MFSYGSGAIGEYFTLFMQPNFEKGFFREEIFNYFKRRQRIDFSTYHHLMEVYRTREMSLEFTPDYPRHEDQLFFLESIHHGHRSYVKK
jgi:3-hydroxy-3-methylglutaryl CoA synthase